MRGMARHLWLGLDLHVIVAILCLAIATLIVNGRVA